MYPHVILFVHIYEIFIHDKTVWQLHCDMNLFGLQFLDIATINYSDRKSETTQKAISKVQNITKSSSNMGKKQCILQLIYTLCYVADLPFFKQTELAALVGDFLLYWMNPCLVPTSTKHVFFFFKETNRENAILI